jgi:hypothetical protein
VKELPKKKDIVKEEMTGGFLEKEKQEPGSPTMDSSLKTDKGMESNLNPEGKNWKEQDLKSSGSYTNKLMETAEFSKGTAGQEMVLEKDIMSKDLKTEAKQ